MALDVHYWGIKKVFMRRFALTARNLIECRDPKTSLASTMSGLPYVCTAFTESRTRKATEQVCVRRVKYIEPCVIYSLGNRMQKGFEIRGRKIGMPYRSFTIGQLPNMSVLRPPKPQDMPFRNVDHSVSIPLPGPVSFSS